MRLSERKDLLTSIADTIADYRRSEGIRITPDHVDRWVCQFDGGDQGVILQEMDQLLKRFYYSRTRAKKSLRSYIRQGVIDGNEPRSTLARTRFLRVQKKGNSQKDLLEIVDEILQEDHGMRVDDCGVDSPDTFVYIDDGIYTGSRFRYDLTPGTGAPSWITKEAPDGCTLKIYVLASHKEGEKYAMRVILPFARRKRIVVDGMCGVRIANERQAGGAECLWPTVVTGNSDVDSYATLVRSKLAGIGRTDALLFRPPNVPERETLFTSPATRETVERAFLVKGSELIQSTEKASMRPLGWEKLESLGFGTLFVTYRNIANNAPLVLWWGGGGWYPLFSPKRYTSQNEPDPDMDLPEDFDDLPF